MAPLLLSDVERLIHDLDRVYRTKPRDAKSLAHSAIGYHEALCDFPREAVETAAKLAVRECKFMPTPAELVPLCRDWLTRNRAPVELRFPKADGEMQCPVCGARALPRPDRPDGTSSGRLYMDHDRAAHGIPLKPVEPADDDTKPLATPEAMARMMRVAKRIGATLRSPHLTPDDRAKWVAWLQSTNADMDTTERAVEGLEVHLAECRDQADERAAMQAPGA